MISLPILPDLFLALPEIFKHHAPSSHVYQVLKKTVRPEIEKLFSSETPAPVDFSPFGSLLFPYQKMGTVDSLNLFDLDELILFSFYWSHRHRYKHVLDIGANLGLHSILLSRCGYQVRSYEPDPHHAELFRKNIALNKCERIEFHEEAVSGQKGMKEFVRVLGNTTGSHLAGSKPNPYGELERFEVCVESILSIMHWADLIKMDTEGHEKDIILATSSRDWSKTDALIEVSSPENASLVFDHLQTLGIKLFAQKNNWERISTLTDMPTSHHEGSLFVTSSDKGPWCH